MNASTRRAVQRLFRGAVDPTLSMSTADVSAALGITEASARETLEALTAVGDLVSTTRDGETRWRALAADGTEPQPRDGDATQSQPAETTWSDALVDQLLDLSASGVVLCDETGTVVRSNHRARDLLGTDETEDRGGLVGTRPWDTLLAEDETPFDPWAVADDGASTAVVEGADDERYALSVTLVDDPGSDSAQLLVSVDPLESSAETDAETDGHADTLVAALRVAISVASEATTRDELEAGLCQRLVETTPYHLAWVGHINWVTETPTQAHWAAVDAPTGEFSRTALSQEAILAGPAAGVVRTRTVAVVPDVETADGVDPDWHAAIRSHGYRSTAAVPLLYETRLYGVLALYSTTANVIDTEHDRTVDTTEVLSELGRAIGHALNALERRDALVSEHVVELSFQSAALAEPYRSVTGADVVIDVENTVIVGSNESVLFINAQHIASDELEAVFEQFPSITATRVVDEDETGCRLVVETSGQTPSLLFAIHGGRTTAAHVEDGVMRFTAEFPRSVDVREVHRALTTVFPDVEMVGYRTKRRVTEPRLSDDLLADAGLTERQRTVLELAHRGGYFAWPKRASSPTDLATTLGIAPQTFLEHLRRGEAKLVAAAFDTRSSSVSSAESRREN